MATIVDIAEFSVSINPLPVKNDRKAMLETLQPLVASPAHFTWVAENDDGIQGALVAQTVPSFWFRGFTCSVLLYHCKTPGGSAPLLRKFSAWVKGRHNIKLAVFELEPEVDPKLRKFITEKLGFGRVSVNATYVRAPK
jgi:hypothetical protein